MSVSTCGENNHIWTHEDGRNVEAGDFCICGSLMVDEFGHFHRLKWSDGICPKCLNFWDDHHRGGTCPTKKVKKVSA